MTDENQAWQKLLDSHHTSVWKCAARQGYDGFFWDGAEKPLFVLTSDKEMMGMKWLTFLPDTDDNGWHYVPGYPIPHEQVEEMETVCPWFYWAVREKQLKENKAVGNVLLG